MQAITTKYHGPTDRRGSRIIARADAGSVQFSYDHSLNVEGNHAAAAATLAAKLGWTDAGELVGGGNADGSYAWVFVNDSAPRAIKA